MVSLVGGRDLRSGSLASRKHARPTPTTPKRKAETQTLAKRTVEPAMKAITDLPRVRVEWVSDGLSCRLRSAGMNRNERRGRRLSAPKMAMNVCRRAGEREESVSDHRSLRERQLQELRGRTYSAERIPPCHLARTVDARAFCSIPNREVELALLVLAAGGRHAGWLQVEIEVREGCCVDRRTVIPL